LKFGRLGSSVIGVTTMLALPLLFWGAPPCPYFLREDQNKGVKSAHLAKNIDLKGL
jgi:hypothetical protein